jgi:hypothetical protein
MAVTVNFNFPRVIRSAEPRGAGRLHGRGHDRHRTAGWSRATLRRSLNTPASRRSASRSSTGAASSFRAGFTSRCRSRFATILSQSSPFTAAERHIDAAQRASAARSTSSLRPASPSPMAKNETWRRFRPARSSSHGRMLAYIAPWFTGSQSDPLPPPNDPERRTLNLDMIANGWAAFFPIYPSLPKNSDMNLAIAEAQAAWDGNKGVWTLPSAAATSCWATSIVCASSSGG